ncbi:MAG: c-type cytochrome biogenesis protein CcmI [Betaproteobacteria bacterium]|nr:c-type cytochrome biogenesis protein CcmI [Betaproteobacteria bacterium]
MFLLIGLTLVLCTALVLIWPLLRKKPPVDQGPGDEAIAAVFKERRRQIQRDLQAGLIQANEAHSAEEALTQELADRLGRCKAPLACVRLRNLPRTRAPIAPRLHSGNETYKQSQTTSTHGSVLHSCKRPRAITVNRHRVLPRLSSVALIRTAAALQSLLRPSPWGEASVLKGSPTTSSSAPLAWSLTTLRSFH